MAPQTLPLRECRTITQAGGKGANLGELVRIGQPVPDGFVITTAALAGLTGPLPPELVTEIGQQYELLGAGPVAVRSSATAEDLPGATFAGQQDTILGVEGTEAVVAAVAECIASLSGERAVAYRARLGISADQVRMAVVVQRMVPADVAGVMFTADPVTGRRDRRSIDAHPGLGEAVVSGAVIPEHHLTDPSGHLEQWTAGESSEQAILTSDQIRLLVRHGDEIAAHFGCPQDIEWAIADGRLHILQARPMTALPPPPVELSRVERLMASIILDYVTVRPYPLDLSTWIAHGPVGMMARIGADIGLVGSYDRLFEQQDSVVTGLSITAPRPTLRLLTAPVRSIGRARRYDPARWREDPRAIELSDEVERMTARDVTRLSPDELLGRVRDCFGLADLVTRLRRDFLPGAGLALIRLTALLRLLGRSTLGPELIQGAPTETTAGNTALSALADLARDDPDLLKRIEAGDVTGVCEHADFAAALDDWLAQYGHRETSSPVLVSQPALVEAPETVLSLVRVLVDAPPRPRSPRVDAQTVLLAHPLLRSRRAQERVSHIVDQARAAVAFREDSHAAFTKIVPLLRPTLLELGRRLVIEGALDQVDDVWHCRWDELVTVPRGDLRRRVAERRMRRQHLDGVPLISIADRTAETLRDDALVVGIPASRGEATGPVRVIRSPKDFGRLRPGEVLVCPYTNPAWTPLFQRAAAVVADSGGSGSHAAIVAREYQIPAVMGTGTGTVVLTDGVRVRVDGDRGLVLAEEP